MAKAIKNKMINEFKKTHKATLILVFVFIVLGIGSGFCATYFLTKNDIFKINGETEITLSLNDTYVEEGATAIAFGKDISSNILIVGEVDTSVAGKYVITYTVNHFRFKNYKLYKLVNVVGQE